MAKKKTSESVSNYTAQFPTVKSFIPSINEIHQNPNISKTRRERTISIEGDEIFCKDGVSVLINTANWLIKKGKITSLNCPIKLQENGKSYLINTLPVHEDGRKFQYGGAELLNNLYIDKNWSKDDCIKKAKDLLIYCDISKFNLS